MTRHHVIISGTGRAGTTFLVQLFTELKLDTGFPDIHTGVFRNSNAGMELDLRQNDAPYFIKNPWLCDNLDEILMTEDIVIDHAIIPIRDLYSAAQSRIHVSEKAEGEGHMRGNTTPGGLWHTSNPAEQESVLAKQLYKLLHTTAKHDIPVIMLLFPKLVSDPKYLYEKIRQLFENISFENFIYAFKKVSRPELVHEFGKKDASL
jgi:hypothetical protein